METISWSRHENPENFDSDEAIDCGAEILNFYEENGVLIVVTERGSFPLDPRFFH